MHPLRLADYYRLQNITAVTISPDGRRAAYVVQGFRKAENDRYQSLWLVPTDGSSPPHRLTRGLTRESAPAFSPDGRYLAFLSTREHELEVAARLAGEAGREEAAASPPAADQAPAGGSQEPSGKGKEKAKPKPKPQIWVLDLQWGGEPRQVTWHEEGIEEFDWAPDSRRLVFSARVPSPAQRCYTAALEGDDKGPIVVSRVQHKHDLHGYLDEVRTHLFVVDLESRESRPITAGPCDETAPRWSPDGEWIVFCSNRTGDADNNKRTDLWLIRPDGSDPRRLTFGDLTAQHPRWSPDSRRVAFLSSLEPENAYRVEHLMVVDLRDAEPVADLQAEVGQGFAAIGGIVPDGPDAPGGDDPVARARVYPVPLRTTRLQVLTGGLDRPATGAPIWLEAERILLPVADRGQIRLTLCSLSGEAGFRFPADQDRLCTLPLVAAAGGTVVAGIDRPETGLDLYAFPAAQLDGSVEPVRLTAVNAELFAGRSLARYQFIQFRNAEGQEIEGLAVIPPGFDPARGRAPLVAVPHGGPQSFDSPRFQFDKQYLAGQGYLLLLVNYRGSTSYGEEFCQVIRGDWGPREHDDLMSGVEHLIQMGWADPERLFITGFSYGGIMTNWAVGHTDRFRAGVSEHGLWDYVSAFGTDDCHLWWQDDLGLPWQNEAQYRRISPMSGVANIRTPLLITAGEVDWRCPPSQGEQLYLALKKRGVPSQLVIYQGERHAITRPRRAIDRLQRICRWFARYGGLPFADASAEGYPDPEAAS